MTLLIKSMNCLKDDELVFSIEIIFGKLQLFELTDLKITFVFKANSWFYWAKCDPYNYLEYYLEYINT